MNILKGKIENINSNHQLSIIYINVNNNRLTAIIIDTPKTAKYLKIGKEVQVIFKETEVIIGKGISHQISMQNKIEGTIKSINCGDLLCKITLKTAVGDIVSIITSNAVKQLGLEKNTLVTAMIKTNEIMLSE
ncbi:TOBE domain-containing protein [Lutibacter sp.]